MPKPVANHQPCPGGKEALLLGPLGLRIPLSGRVRRNVLPLTHAITTLVILKRAFELRLAFERLVNAAFEWQRLNERLFECLGHFPAFGVAFKCCVSNGRLVIAFGNCVCEALSLGNISLTHVL